jgi:23S rRNA (guanine745-N1)-methyltransferase
VLFVCPLDGSTFDEMAGGVRCGLGHAFDRAREGYLNLLVGGRKPSRPAGDSPEMLRARRAVFERGHYDPVMAAVAAQVAASAPHGGVVLDAGCGEGAYLAQVGRVRTDVSRWGVDIAKPAVVLAARRDRAAGFAVASSYALPIADATVDAVMTVFSPRPFAEFTRVLRPGGGVISASPGPDHLAGLTDLVYGRHRPHGEKPHTVEGEDTREAAPGDERPHEPRRRERVRFALDLRDSADITHLLQMTPHYWHATAERREAIAALDRLETVVDVIVTTHTA